MSTGSKMGRPLKENEPLSKDLKIRVSDRTYKKLSDYSADHDMSIAETARKGIKKFLEDNKK